MNGLNFRPTYRKSPVCCSIFPELCDKRLFSSPVVSAVVGSTSSLLLFSLIAVALLAWKVRRMPGHRQEKVQPPVPSQPTDTSAYMDLRPVAPTYQALRGSSRVGQPNEAYEEVPMTRVNPCSSDYEIPNEHTVWSTPRKYGFFCRAVTSILSLSGYCTKSWRTQGQFS